MQDGNDLERRLFELESRLEALEQWKASLNASEPKGREARALPPKVTKDVVGIAAREAIATDDSVEPEVVQPPPVDFDLALVGRTLIVLGGAFLLRAITEQGALPAVAGVSLGLAYAVTWLFVALRPGVSRTSAAYHGVAAVLAAYPLLFEATRKFHVLDAWSSALTLTLVSAICVVLSWRKMLNGLAWVATTGAMALSALLMLETNSMVPFVWFLIALGVTTLWMGYRLKWHLLRWPVAAFLDIVLLLMAFLVVTDRIVIAPAVAMAAGAGAFAAYLFSFVFRNLLRERNVVTFEAVQTIAALVTALGGAMWIAATKDTLEIPIAIAVLAIAAASYGASFVFIPRHFSSPLNFFFYSSLALVLVLGAGAFIAEGVPSSVLWSALALTAAYFAGKYEKPVLAVHCAIYLIAGAIGADIIQTGVRMLVATIDGDWGRLGAGVFFILAASVIAAGIHPIERGGSFAIWKFAKLTILVVLGWILATVIMWAVGAKVLGPAPDPGITAMARTGVLSGLTILAAWLARFAFLSPARQLSNVLLVILAMKLLWEDLRVGNPLTMFLSFAFVGAAMILATRFRRDAAVPVVKAVRAPAMPEANGHVEAHT